jgi:hypothetical protein
MKSEDTSDRPGVDGATAPAATKRSVLDIRLVSRPDQTVLREWEIRLPDDLIAVLTMGDI